MKKTTCVWNGKTIYIGHWTYHLFDDTMPPNRIYFNNGHSFQHTFDSIDDWYSL